MLRFGYKCFGDRVPDLGDPSGPSAKGLDGEDWSFLEKVEVGFERVGELHNACKFRAVLGKALRQPLFPSGRWSRSTTAPRSPQAA